MSTSSPLRALRTPFRAAPSRCKTTSILLPPPRFPGGVGPPRPFHTRATLLPSTLAGCSHWSRTHCLRHYSAAQLDGTKAEEEEMTVAEDFMEDIEGEEGETPELDDQGVLVDQVDPVTSSSTSADRPRLPRSMKKLNRLLSRHQILHIPEDELKETFIRGRGPGGQAINKTSSCVSLIHLPTGVRVQAQPTRSREQNRTAARHILREKLDSLRVSGAIPGGVTSSEVSPTPDQGGMVSPREEKKAAEKNLAAVYAKDELKAAKVRLRKANRARKHKKKKRAMEGDKEADEGGVDDGV